jgi:YidC/Oxa1 family membrane protein insertase
VVAAVVFLVVYNFTSNESDLSESSTADRTVANAAVGSETVVKVPTVEPDSSLFRVEVSHAGGALSSFQLLKDQFSQADRTADGKSYIPESRLVAGPYEVVGPWSPAYYPFQLKFSQLDWDGPSKDMQRVVRAETSAIWSGDGLRATLGDLVDGDLALRQGDVLVAGSFSAPIAAVTDDGSAAFATPPAERPTKVTVIRTGSALAQYQADSTFSQVASGDSSVVALVWPNPARDTSDVYIERRWTVSDTYRLQHELRFVNLAPNSLRTQYRIAVNGWVDPFAEPPGMFSPPIQDWSPTCFVDGSHEEETLQDLVDEGGQVTFPGSTSWFGVNSQFFLLVGVFDKTEGVQGTCSLEANAQGVIGAVFGRSTADVIPGASSVCEPDWLAVRSQKMSCAKAMAALGVDESHLDEASLERALDAFEGSRERATQYKIMLSAYREAQSEGRLAFSVYAGPKDLGRLEAITPSLDNTLDFWFVGALAKPMLWFLKFLYDLVSIWWVAILLLTVAIRMAMLPLTQKSYVQMQKMKELKPEIDAIQKKYGNDKQRLQAEMMNVYKRHNMNPLGGCFPMLLQMPLYFALYRCLYAAVDLYQAPLFGWITDMTQPDPYYVLPALLGVFMFVQQQFMPSAGGDEMQQKIIKYVMPVMFSVFMFMLPSGLVFYIFVSTVISVGQQWWIKRQFENSTASTRSKAA